MKPSTTWGYDNMTYLYSINASFQNLGPEAWSSEIWWPWSLSLQLNLKVSLERTPFVHNLILDEKANIVYITMHECV